MPKDRVVPEREVTGADRWWEESAKPRVQATRVQRQGRRPTPPKKDFPPSWRIVAMLLALIVFVGICLLLYQDYRRALVEGRSTTSTAKNRPSGLALPASPSLDTIKTRLQDRGFEVDYLVSVADQRNLAYDVAETHINGTPALILVFKDHATTLKWVRGSSSSVVYHNSWAVSVPDQDLAARIAQKMKADLRG